MIDWTKPLELMDGTPVRLSDMSDCGATNPDSDGDYWLEREDGGLLDGFSRACHSLGGSNIKNIRNRAEPNSAGNYEMGQSVVYGKVSDLDEELRSRIDGAHKELRDRFAMSAIPYCMGGANPSEIAEEAYAIADAMFQQRLI